LNSMSSKELSYWMAYFRIEAVEMEMEKNKNQHAQNVAKRR